MAGHRLLGSKRHDREYTSLMACWCIIVGIITLTPCICLINLFYARGVINAEHVRPISLLLPFRGKSVYGHACDKSYPDPNLGLIYVTVYRKSGACRTQRWNFLGPKNAALCLKAVPVLYAFRS